MGRHGDGGQRAVEVTGDLEVAEAGNGDGRGDGDLPLAGPVLLAGVRVVSVSTVSLVTVGSLIGVSTLGNLFLDGFQRSFFEETITGIMAVLAVAISFDAVLVLIGRFAMPWNRRPKPPNARRHAAVHAQAVPR